jgi:phosphatidate cytidylyltransferase
MLKQRVITAVVLLLIVLAALLQPGPAPFIGLALLMVCAAGWEWARLNGLSGYRAWLPAAGVAVLAGLAWFWGWPAQQTPRLWLAVGLLWVGLAWWLLRGGVAAWQRLPQGLRLMGGLLVLVLAWLAIAQARVLGLGLLLSVCALVWTADIAAYFFGRALGQKFFARKLAPALSPGKSWEGALGGMAMVLLLACGWRAAEPVAALGPSLFALLAGQPWWLFVLSLIFLTLFSIAGDLLESLVKRSAGAKDSSQLLPGHGGVLDRIDALLPTFPLAMMLVALLR